MFKAWFNRRGYKNIFYFIAGIHSPSLLGYRAMEKAGKELNKKYGKEG